MQNYIQEGENITLDAPAAVVSGEALQVGSLFGVSSNDAASGETMVLVTTGVFELPKLATDAIAVGDPVYWDSANGEVTLTDTDNMYVGQAVSVAANPSGTVRVRLAV